RTDQLVVGNASGEGDVVGHAKPYRQRLRLLPEAAVADEHELDIGSALLDDDAAHRFDEEIEAFLLAHDADIADQVAAAVTPSRIRVGMARPACQAGAGANHEDAGTVLAAALHGDGAIAFVR